jgi:hypothetical protein
VSSCIQKPTPRRKRRRARALKCSTVRNSSLPGHNSTKYCSKPVCAKMGNELSCSEGKTCDSDEFISCLENRTGSTLPGMPVRFTGHSKPDTEVQLSGVHSGGTAPDHGPVQTPMTARLASKEGSNRQNLSLSTSSSALNSPHSEPGQDVLHPLSSHRSGSQTSRQHQPGSMNKLNPLAPSNGAIDILDREAREAAAKSHEQKAGWIQMSITISDMSISGWTQHRQDAFIETVAMTTRVPLSDICVLSLKEKCGRRLLSNAVEVTVGACLYRAEYISRSFLLQRRLARHALQDI